MGLGPVKNGKQSPITPWQGSWAEQQQAKKGAVMRPQKEKRIPLPLTADIPDGLTITGRVDTKSKPWNE